MCKVIATIAEQRWTSRRNERCKIGASLVQDEQVNYGSTKRGGGMKVIILSDIESFCREHNFQTISLKTLREMAIDDDDDGKAKAYKEGYAHAHQVITETLAKEKP